MVSSADLFAGASLTTLSFLASVVQGSTSLGDGIFLQITWGILQALVPFLGESSLGNDGLRVITMFMYVRIVTMTPTLIYWLWNDYRKQVKSASESKAATAHPPRIMSSRMCWILTAPSIVWALLGVIILQRVESKVLSVYLGAVCITFSVVYMSLRLWKMSAHESMPRFLKDILSPAFFKAGTDGSEDSHLTTGGQIALLLASNLCGLMTTLAGIGSPPIMVIILLYNIPVNLTRFTMPVGATVGAVIRLAFALYTGMVHLDMWPFYIPATIMGLVGLNIGVSIGNVLTPSMYSATIFCLLINAGIVMLTKNTMITVPALVIPCFLLAYKHFVLDASERRKAKATKENEDRQTASISVVVDSNVINNNTISFSMNPSTHRSRTQAHTPMNGSAANGIATMQKEELVDAMNRMHEALPVKGN